MINQMHADSPINFEEEHRINTDRLQAEVDEAVMALPCLVDDETRAAMRVNKDINRELERWKRDQSKEYKLLLLGKWNAKILCGEFSMNPQSSHFFLS